MAYTNQRFFLNFNLEILYGCQFSCDGCHVNKNGQRGFPDGDLVRFQNLIEDFKTRAYDPSLLVIGPTDVFSAKNTKEILLDPDFQKFTAPFVRFTFNTTFLVVDEEIIHILNEHYADKEIEFKIVIEASQFKNDGYLTKINTNRKKAERLLKCKGDMTIHPQFNLFNYGDAKLADELDDYIALNDRSDEYFGQGIDFVLSFSRSEELSKEQKLEMLLWLKNTFINHVTPENANTIHFDSGHLTDFEEHVFTYRNGSFYFSPKVYDDYVAFDEELKIDIKDWTAEEFEKFEQDTMMSQYLNLDSKPCITCKYAPTCVDRGVPYFMDYIGVDYCIIPKDAFDLLNKGV